MGQRKGLVQHILVAVPVRVWVCDDFVLVMTLSHVCDGHVLASLCQLMDPAMKR